MLGLTGGFMEFARLLALTEGLGLFVKHCTLFRTNFGNLVGLQLQSQLCKLSSQPRGVFILALIFADVGGLAGVLLPSQRRKLSSQARDVSILDLLPTSQVVAQSH